jgi:hypothetical protein
VRDENNNNKHASHKSQDRGLQESQQSLQKMNYRTKAFHAIQQKDGGSQQNFMSSIGDSNHVSCPSCDSRFPPSRIAVLRALKNDGQSTREANELWV